MEKKPKILICGDVKGKYETFIAHIINLSNELGPFEIVFCIGDFFGYSEHEWTTFKASKKISPIPIYILGPNQRNHISYYSSSDGQELAGNIFYIGKRGLFSTKSGLKIAYLSGTENTTEPKICRITKEDVGVMTKACIKDKHSYTGIDLLLTSCWPTGVIKYDKNKNLQSLKISRSSNLISTLAAIIKPRYHFCALENKYHEQAPYRNLDTGDRVKYVPKMIALENFEKANKDKCLYILHISPVQQTKSSDLTMTVADAIECPYSVESVNIRQHAHNCFTKHHYNKRKSSTYEGRKVFKFLKFDRNLTINQNACWFCIASENFERHLIINVGDYAYLSLAKGPLTKHHVIIAPRSHSRLYHRLPREAKTEIAELKTTLIAFFKKQQKSVVFFERNFKSPHLQLHAVPIPTELVGKAKKFFMQISSKVGCPLTEIPRKTSLSDIIHGREIPYFYVEIEETKLLYIIKHDVQFPLYLGREILAHKDLLNAPNKIDWRKCQLSKDEEIKLTKDFRKKVFHD